MTLTLTLFYLLLIGINVLAMVWIGRPFWPNLIAIGFIAGLWVTLLARGAN